MSREGRSWDGHRVAQLEDTLKIYIDENCVQRRERVGLGMPMKV